MKYNDKIREYVIAASVSRNLFAVFILILFTGIIGTHIDNLTRWLWKLVGIMIIGVVFYVVLSLFFYLKFRFLWNKLSRDEKEICSQTCLVPYMSRWQDRLRGWVIPYTGRKCVRKGKWGKKVRILVLVHDIVRLLIPICFILLPIFRHLL